MNGNVWEWVEDCWPADYSGTPRDGSARTGGKDCSQRVLRGGSWNNSAAAIRSEQRSGGAPDARANNNAASALPEVTKCKNCPSRG